MRPFHHAMIAAALLPLAAASPALAQDAGIPNIFMVNYIEAIPSAKPQVANMLKQLASASRKEAGVFRFEALQRTAPASHFAILEVWKDQQALDSHTAAEHTKKFRSQLQPLLIAPFDDRLCIATSVGPVQPLAGARGRYVVTHVDIGPPNPANRDNAVSVFKTFSETTRKDAGNLRYDVVVQKARLNHFKVIEVWKDQKSEYAHETAAHTKELRVKFAPLMGSLYDHRWYTAL